jgi:hypothetical protein
MPVTIHTLEDLEVSWGRTTKDDKYGNVSYDVKSKTEFEITVVNDDSSALTVGTFVFKTNEKSWQKEGTGTLKWGADSKYLGIADQEINIVISKNDNKWEINVAADSIAFANDLLVSYKRLDMATDTEVYTGAGIAVVVIAASIFGIAYLVKKRKKNKN